MRVANSHFGGSPGQASLGRLAGWPGPVGWFAWASGLEGLGLWLGPLGWAPGPVVGRPGQFRWFPRLAGRPPGTLQGKSGMNARSARHFFIKPAHKARSARGAGKINCNKT